MIISVKWNNKNSTFKLGSTPLRGVNVIFIRSIRTLC